MANGYSKIFTLSDLFSDKALSKVIPTMSGKKILGFKLYIYNLVKQAAKEYYKPFIPSMSGNSIHVDGTLVGDTQAVADGIYNVLMANKQLIEFSVNGGNMISSALSESLKAKQKTGIEPKLYLKVQSKAEILGMNNRRKVDLMNSIMENIIFSDDFPNTQMRYHAEKLTKQGADYITEWRKWALKVGEL